MKKSASWQAALLKDHIDESIRKACIKMNNSRQELALELNRLGLGLGSSHILVFLSFDRFKVITPYTYLSGSSTCSAWSKTENDDDAERINKEGDNPINKEPENN